MEIEIFTLCDFAQDNNSKLTVVGTFDSINSKQFPYVHGSFSVACRLRFSEKEIGIRDMQLRFSDGKGGEILKPIEAQMNVTQPKNGQYTAVNLVFNFGQVKFDKPGRYSFELYIDNEWKSGLPLFLNQIA